jgi:hypothetical protein
MKKITLEAFISNDFNKVMFNVASQTHTGYAFGPDGQNKFRASNGIVLGSNRNPARDADDKNTIWLRGSDSSKNNNTVVVGKTRFAKVAAAIKEYNEYFVYKAPVAAAPAPSCSVIIG